ncbi:MAG: DUF4276 family protein [Planctomycetales bacterium]
MKFVLFVEGPTERDSAARFLKRWLDPQLRRPIGIQVVKFTGWSDFAKEIALKVQLQLDGPSSSEIVAAVGLLDLYGPHFYPSHLATAKERYEWGVAHFEKQVGRERFRMFFAVHEYEAWLLSQPDHFHPHVKPAVAKVKLPEAVNFDEPPAKLMARLYLQHTKRTYKKTTHGRQLFETLDPQIAADKCPYLKRMLEELLKLAKGAGL